MSLSSITSLTDLQARLPAGIKITLVKNKVHYSVRTSRNGKKYSLGTYVELEDAIQALIAFKNVNASNACNDRIVALPQTMIGTQPQAQPLEQTLPIDMQNLLDLIGVHNLESNKPYRHITEDGEIIDIPAHIVTMYINSIYFGTQDQAQNQDQDQTTSQAKPEPEPEPETTSQDLLKII
jgi:hypothetical protein